MYAHSYTLHYSIHEASSCDMISYWMKPYHNIISYIVIIIILIFILVIILIVVIILMNNHFFFFYVSSFFFNTTIFRQLVSNRHRNHYAVFRSSVKSHYASNVMTDPHQPRDQPHTPMTQHVGSAPLKSKYYRCKKYPNTSKAE